MNELQQIAIQTAYDALILAADYLPVEYQADIVEASDLLYETFPNIYKEDETPEYDESMDGDHESALASAGFGTDEDYGGGEEHI